MMIPGGDLLMDTWMGWDWGMDGHGHWAAAGLGWSALDILYITLPVRNYENLLLHLTIQVQREHHLNLASNCSTAPSVCLLLEWDDL